MKESLTHVPLRPISIRTHQVIREFAVFLKPIHTCFPESPEHWWINWDRVEPETLYCKIQRNYCCCCSVISDSVSPWTAALQASLPSTISWSLLRLISIESVMPSNYLILYCPFSSGSFPRSQFFTSGGQNIRASASASVLPMNIQGWSPLGWTGWISLQSKGFSRVFSNTTVQKHQFFGTQLSLWFNSHIHTWLLEKL